MGDSETPNIGVVESKHMLALHRCVSLRSFANAGWDPINQQLAPLNVCSRCEGSRWLWEHRLYGVGDEVGGVLKLGEGCGRAADYD